MAVRTSGKVVQVTVDREGTFLRLDNPPEEGPKDNRWLLSVDHANYNALFSLVVAAAAGRWTLTVRVAGDGQIDTTQLASVKSIDASWG